MRGWGAGDGVGSSPEEGRGEALNCEFDEAAYADEDAVGADDEEGDVEGSFSGGEDAFEEEED